MNRRTFVISTGALMALPAIPSHAATTHDVAMLNKHPEDKKQRMVYLPRVLVVQPGDVVKFLPTDKGHNAESIKGMIPEGAEKWKSKINKEIEVTISTPGVYGYKCTPHYATGMVGLIICEGDGKLANLDAAKAVKQKGKAAKVFEAIWAEAEAMGALA
jgi:pseudoazurin